MISRGALKDFTVLNFAGALLEVSLVGNDDAIKRESGNKHYKENKRIDRRIKALREKTKEVLTEVGNLCTEDEAKYAKKSLNKVGKLLYWFEQNDQNINLEILALYIIFINFDANERKQIPLHQVYSWFANSDNYLDTNAEMISELLSGDTETKMFLLAYECVSKLKG